MKKLFSILSVFVLAFCLTVPVFAYDFGDGGNLGDITDEMQTYYDDGYEYACLLDYGGGAKYLFLTTAPMKQNNVNGYVSATESLSYVRYTASGNKWVYVNKGTLASNQEPTSQRLTVLWSSYNFKDNTGNLIMSGDPYFFPQVPLAELVLEVTEGELVEVAIPNLVGALKILVPCGVGCLALLAGLKLFGKRSLIFRR